MASVSWGKYSFVTGKRSKMACIGIGKARARVY